MAEVGKYLYCIIPCLEERTFGTAAMGGEKGAVHTVCHQGLAAVVSDSPMKQYESTRTNMMAHQAVLEAVMKEFALLPVRFGTVANAATTVADIKRLLASRYEEFWGLLSDMGNKVELGLKAFWRDEKAIFQEILAENADIRKLRDSLAGKAPAAIHFQGIPLGQRVKEALDRKRSQEAARILHPLRPIAQQVRENDTLVDRVVLNAAFLVSRDREPDFDEAVRRLDEEMCRRVAFKYVGPVPPYNFVNIVVNWQEL